MLRVRYAGPYAVLEVDGIRISRGGEADLSQEQFARVQNKGAVVIEVEATAPEGGETAEEVNSNG